MKLFKKLRKGFTLIELVVVIAVIAILSAVSVVSYVAITNRAKQSADEQAVRQMNTILAANSVMDLKSINDVYAAFAENDISAEDYKPLFKDRYFFWDSTTNQVVYTDKNYVVIYPESLKGQSKGDHQWYSLTQSLAKVEIKQTDKVTVDVDGVPTQKPVKEIIPAASSTTSPTYNFAVETPEQLYTLGQEMKEAMLNTSKGTTQTTSAGYKVTADSSVAYILGDVVIDLAGDLDLMGGAFNFSVKGNFTLRGHGHKITGVVNNKDFYTGSSKTASGQSQPEKYGAGLLGYIAGADSSHKVNALFEDVTIENSVFGFSESKGGGLVGYASNANIVFDKVAVENCNMEAFEHSVGGFLGDVQSGVTVTLKHANSVKNCNLKLHEGTNSDKECYGAGYFVGRQVGSDFSVVKDTATSGSFTQSGNTKKHGSNNTINKTGGFSSSYKYWDTADEGLSF